MFVIKRSFKCSSRIRGIHVQVGILSFLLFFISILQTRKPSALQHIEILDKLKKNILEEVDGVSYSKLTKSLNLFYFDWSSERTPSNVFHKQSLCVIDMEPAERCVHWSLDVDFLMGFFSSPESILFGYVKFQSQDFLIDICRTPTNREDWKTKARTQLDNLLPSLNLNLDQFYYAFLYSSSKDSLELYAKRGKADHQLIFFGAM